MQNLQLYQTGFTICMVGAILCAVLCVVMVFLFDIVSIFKLRTGIAKNKAIREISEASRQSGGLRYDEVAMGDKTPAGLGRRADIQPPVEQTVPLTPPSLAVQPGGQTAEQATEKTTATPDLPEGFVMLKNIVLVHTDEAI